MQNPAQIVNKRRIFIPE